MSGIDDYFGAAGDMFSGSDDPVEQNRALEREVEKRRREQEREREQARILREQQAVQAEFHKSLQQAPPLPVVIDNNQPAFVSKPDPDDPLDGVPDEKRTDILLHKYDNGNRKPTDYLGGEMSRDRQNEYIDVWKNRVRNSDEDMRYILLHQSMKYDPNVKKQVEQAKRQFQEWLPIPEAQTLEFRLDGKDHPSNAYRTLEYRPDRDGVPSIQNAIQYANEPVKVVKTDNNFLSQIMSVTVPQDQSMTPLYRELSGIYGSVFGPDKPVTGYGRSYPYHTDQSYGEAERQAGKAAVQYVNKGLGPKSRIYGKDGTRTVREPDQTTGKLVSEGFRNMNHDAIATAQDDIGISQGFRYDPKHGSREAFSFEKGIDKAVLDGKIAFHSFASLTGELVYSVTGGDPKALRAVQATLKEYKRQMDELQPMKLDQVYVEGDPERTMQNVTDYFYQTLGDQMVKVPMSVLMGKADSIAAITGMSSAAVASNIHAGLLEKTGEAHAAEAVMYGVPLGMLSLLNIPFQPPASIRSPADLMGWVQSVVTEYGVGKAQVKGAKAVVRKYGNKFDADKPR